MKQLLLLLITLSLSSQCLLAQAELTLTGDPTDSTLLALKAKMEAKGFKVQIRAEDPVEAKFTSKALTEFTFNDLSGNSFSSQALKGKKVHINFWSVTCKPCIEEFPELNQLKEKYQDEHTVFLAIAPDPIKQVNKILAKHPLDYTILPDAEALFKELEIEAYPVNFFVNEEGMIQEVIHGASYTSKMVEGEMKMIPDNFGKYEKALLSLSE